jgi:glycosyltransferase involved in cell wall biosynthesis
VTPARPDVSVVICSWNRDRLLDRTLEGLADLRLPAALAWEVLVVDNGSEDGTADVLAKHAVRLPLRVIEESERGLSRARNRALDEVRGPLVLWTDDDVRVDPGWLSEIVAAARRFPDEPIFGGTVDPWFEEEPPRWIRRNLDQLEGTFAIRRFGPEVRRFRDGEAPFGANMAVRKDAIGSERFRTDLGRIGTSLLSGEESEFLARIRDRTGRPGVWVGTARVEHWVPRERLQPAYVRRYFEGLGRTHVAAHGIPRGTNLFGVPAWIRRREIVERIVATFLRPWGRSRAWLVARRRAWELTGMRRAILDLAGGAADRPA